MIRPSAHKSLAFGVVMLLAARMTVLGMTATDKEEYERRGLSQVEWEMVLDAKMPKKKVDELLKAGISISEYFRYPWLKFGISEQQWINSRKAGLLDSDIAAENKPRGPAEGAVVISAFLLPGYHQCKREQYWKTGIMTGAAVLGATLLAVRSVQERALIPGPLALLVPAMLWSSLDIGLQLNRQRNPDAERFSEGSFSPDAMCVSLRVSSK
ncbi:MAG: hypothetical protein GF418_10440 [Chitinivibrionales bacterium]|nr:hypothetical protein [Chitinivibrionales bacterium]MBD3396031.1 hypothetical protein [Chitinivibrionales bacterium]